MAEPFVLKGKKIWVAGHGGMVGSAVVRRLMAENCEILTVERKEVELTRQEMVESWVCAHKPQVIILCAARVGGIQANASKPVEFLYENLMIQANIIKAAHDHHAEKLLFLGSSCIYPRLAKSPITEDSLLTGPLEPTNQWYAIAKISGLKLCQAYRRQYGADFISAMPTNLYGPGDNFHLQESHVVAALLRKAHSSKLANSTEIQVWGTGRPRREFLFIDDLADALVFLLKNYSSEQTINIGTGAEVSIEELAYKICETVGIKPQLVFDSSMPDGTPRKLLDVSQLSNLGWTATTSLDHGLRETYEWFLEHVHDFRGRKAALSHSSQRG